jgi:hypothetical protein
MRKCRYAQIENNSITTIPGGTQTLPEYVCTLMMSSIDMRARICQSHLDEDLGGTMNTNHCPHFLSLTNDWVKCKYFSE